MPKYKRESRPGIADADSGGQGAKNSSGGYGPHKGNKGMSYPKDKYKKRKGFSDHGDGYDKKHYEDGGIVESPEFQAKMAAITKLRQDASQWNNAGLKQHFQDGGIVAKVTASNPKDLQRGLEKAAEIMKHREEDEESEMDYDDMSRDELIEMLKKQK